LGIFSTRTEKGGFTGFSGSGKYFMKEKGALIGLILLILSIGDKNGCDVSDLQFF
jgi:hypothetical protein